MIEKRSGKDIWQNLYQFPLIETEKEVSEGELRKIVAERYGVSEESLRLLPASEKIRHILSHQELHCMFYYCEVPLVDIFGVVKVSPKGLKSFAFPIVIVKFLKKLRLLAEDLG